jgi:hypothetical protein
VRARAVLAEERDRHRVPDKTDRTSVGLFATGATSEASASLRRNGVRSVMPARPELRVDPEPAPWAAHRRGLVGYRSTLGPRPARPAVSTVDMPTKLTEGLKPAKTLRPPLDCVGQWERLRVETPWRNATPAKHGFKPQPRRETQGHCLPAIQSSEGGRLVRSRRSGVAGSSTYGRLPTILSISSRPNARIVMVRTFPCTGVSAPACRAVPSIVGELRGPHGPVILPLRPGSRSRPRRYRRR